MHEELRSTGWRWRSTRTREEDTLASSSSFDMVFRSDRSPCMALTLSELVERTSPMTPSPLPPSEEVVCDARRKSNALQTTGMRALIPASCVCR